VVALAPSPDAAAANGAMPRQASSSGSAESPTKRVTGLPPRRPSSSPHASSAMGAATASAAVAVAVAGVDSTPDDNSAPSTEGGGFADGKASPTDDRYPATVPVAPAMFVSRGAGTMSGADGAGGDGGDPIPHSTPVPGLQDAGGSSGEASAREGEDHVMPLRDEGRHGSLGATTTTTNVQDASSRSGGSQHTLNRGASDHMTTLHSPDSDRSMHTSSRTQLTAGGDSVRAVTDGGELTPTHARPPPSPADQERAALLARTVA